MRPIYLCRSEAQKALGGNRERARTNTNVADQYLARRNPASHYSRRVGKTNDGRNREIPEILKHRIFSV